MENLARLIQRGDSYWRKVDTIFASIACGFLFVATALVISDVSGRYFLNKPITGSVEVTGLIMAYIGFFGFAYTLAKGGHVRVTLALDHCPPRVQVWADIITCLVGLFCLGTLIIFGWRQFWLSYSIKEVMLSQTYVPAWVAKFAMPAGLLVFLIQYLFRLLVNITRIASKRPITKQEAEKALKDGMGVGVE